MRKLILILLLFCAFKNQVKAQFPVNQQSGSANTLKTELGAIRGVKGVIVGTYNDTLEANAGYINSYYGALIIVKDTLFVRNKTANKWVYAGTKNGSGGYGIDSAAFRVAQKINDSTFMLKSLIDSTTITLSSSGGGSYSGIDSAAFRVARKVNDTSFMMKSLLDSTLISFSGGGGSGGSGIDSAAYRVVEQLNDSSYLIKSFLDSTILIFSGGGSGDFDTTNIYNAIAQRLLTTDTTNKWVNRVEQPLSNVLRFFKGSSFTDFTLPSGGGGSGTVTSVAATIGSGALSISGSPITTSGTLNFTWNSTNSKQVLGDGSLIDRITDNSQLTNGAGYITTVPPQTWASITGKPSFFSGDYNDLINKPTIPALIDTANKWINRVEQPSSNVLRFFKGGSYNDVTLPSGGSVTALDSILNVNTTGKKQGSQLSWDVSTSKWIAKVDTVIFKMPLKVKKTTGQKDTIGIFLPAYSIPANNTSDSAFSAPIAFRDFPEQAYTDSIWWTGTTAPSGTAVNRWSGTQIGKNVTINIVLNYATEGTSLTAVTLRLPTGAPPPLVMSGVQVLGGVFLYPANMYISRNNGSVQKTPATTSPSQLQFSQTDVTKYDLTAGYGTSSIKTVMVQVIYRTP